MVAARAAATAGLSERYVNELLLEAGASFTTRLTGLRLRRAADLLAHRRRFGLTPTAARGT
ncbi:hypothetical protein ACQ86E_17125 [Bradyrhizobium betae]|uniref:hypothetical protein n=1 Tax=Bradyrhizobium betae TaxID=244734 RepID=UPI003D66408A